MAGLTWPSLVAGARAKASEVEAKFDWFEGHLVPMLNGARVSDTYDIGEPSTRWRNMYLSGGLFLADGSPTSPSIANASNADTGIWFGVDNVSFSFDGTNGHRFRYVSGSYTWHELIGPSQTYSIGVNGGDQFGIAVGTDLASNIAFSVESDGNITFPLNCAFTSYHTTAANITGSGTAYTLATWNFVTDVNNNFSDTSGIFRAPATGIYFLGCHMNWSSSLTGTSLNLDMYVNGSVSRRTNIVPRSKDNMTILLEGLINLSASDTVYYVLTGDGFGANNVSLVSGLGGSLDNRIYGYKVA